MITRRPSLTLFRSMQLPARAHVARELRSYPGNWTYAPSAADGRRVITRALWARAMVATLMWWLLVTASVIMLAYV